MAWKLYTHGDGWSGETTIIDEFDLIVCTGPDFQLKQIMREHGATGTLRQELIEARSHLAAALVQSIPSDDQIIIGHIETAAEILTAAIGERCTLCAKPATRKLDNLSYCDECNQPKAVRA